MVMIFLSGEGSFSLRCVIETTVFSLFSDDRPKIRLYDDGSLKTMYLIVIVLVASPSKKVVCSSTYPCTSTWLKGQKEF